MGTVTPIGRIATRAHIRRTVFQCDVHGVNGCRYCREVTRAWQSLDGRARRAERGNSGRELGASKPIQRSTRFLFWVAFLSTCFLIVFYAWTGIGSAIGG